MAKPITAKPIIDPDANKGSKATIYGASAMAVAAGVGTTRYTLQDHAYQNLKKRGVFDDIRAEHAQKLHAKIDAPLADVQKGLHETPKDFPAIFKEVYQDRRQQIRQRMHDVGVSGITDEWRMSHKVERRNAIVLGMSVSTILLGATLTILSAFRGKEPTAPTDAIER